MHKDSSGQSKSNRIGAIVPAETLIVGRAVRPLSGRMSVPSDKSITHRALFFGALSGRTVVVRNPLPSLDCTATRNLLETLGYRIDESGPDLIIDPHHRYDLPASDAPYGIDCGNSGTTARLASGFLTGEAGMFRLVGDASLSKRPMERVAEPLRRIGGNVTTTDGAFPVEIVGGGSVVGNPDDPIEVRSAQVHAALTLAGLRSERGVLLRRTRPMRDHTLRICAALGMTIESDGETDRVIPLREDSLHLTAPDSVQLVVPGDPSSAAFLVAAALLVPGSDITIEGLGLNPTRIAFFRLLKEMGADIDWRIERDDWEPLGSMRVRYTQDLSGMDLNDASDAAVEEMMDELPLVGLIGSQADGTTTIRGAAELRVKESDRIAATASLLRSLGIQVEEYQDGFSVLGSQPMVGGVRIDHHGDHRLAMLAAVAGLIADRPVEIPNIEVAEVSWPGFSTMLTSLA